MKNDELKSLEEEKQDIRTLVYDDIFKEYSNEKKSAHQALTELEIIILKAESMYSRGIRGTTNTTDKIMDLLTYELRVANEVRDTIKKREQGKRGFPAQIEHLIEKGFVTSTQNSWVIVNTGLPTVLGELTLYENKKQLPPLSNKDIEKLIHRKDGGPYTQGTIRQGRPQRNL